MNNPDELCDHVGAEAESGLMAPGVCRNCGSRRFLSDRSLAGRLICQNCGLPAGSGGSRMASGRRGSSYGRNNTNRWRWLLLLGVIVIVIVLFTA